MFSDAHAVLGAIEDAHKAEDGEHKLECKEDGEDVDERRHMPPLRNLPDPACMMRALGVLWGAQAALGAVRT